MRLHDLRENGKTMAAPVCVKWAPSLSKTGHRPLYTLHLLWDLDLDILTKVIWPGWVSDTDRTDILRAVKPKGEGVEIRNLPNLELECDLACLIGGEEQVVLTKVPARLIKQEVVAVEKSCRVRVLLRIETSREDAPLVWDLWGSDVVVTVRRQSGLFEIDGDHAPGGETGAGEDEPNGKQLQLGGSEELPPEPIGRLDMGSPGEGIPAVPVAAEPVPRNDGLTPEESLGKAPKKKGKGKKTPPAAEA